MPGERIPGSALSPTIDIIDAVLGGRYRIIELIGSGGMASVYRATDEELPRQVAVKFMRPESAGRDEELRQRIEIETLASLNHPAVVTLIDAGMHETPEGECAFLVMELVDGPTLRDVLASGLSPDQIAHIGADVAEGLHYMHSRGVVHRDIKPANILLTESELPDRRFSAKLADFGIARILDGDPLTSTGIVLGSAPYLSPEQATGRSAGAACDIYSLGLVLLECLTHRRAFPGTTAETLAARVNAAPSIPDSVGFGWAGLLSDMTALEPERRPTALDVAVRARTLATVESAADANTVPIDPLLGQEQQPLLGRTRQQAAGDPPTLAYPVRRPDAHQPAVAGAVVATSPVVTDSVLAADPVTDSTMVRKPDAEAKRLESTPKTPRSRGDAVRRRLAGMLAGMLLALVVVAGAITAGSSDTASAPSEPAITYPAVPGPLGTHLEQLQDSVMP